MEPAAPPAHLSPKGVSPTTALAVLLRPRNLAMWHFQSSAGSVCSPVKVCFLPLMEDRNARMESTNLCVALWALVDLWSEKQRKVSGVPLAQHGMAWHSQASAHQCPSLHRAQHDVQHHPFTGSSICEDLLWDYAQPQPGTGPCSLPAGQPPQPRWDSSVIPVTLAAALPYGLSQTQPGPSPGLGSTRTVGKFVHNRNSLQGARGCSSILSFPLLPRACQSHVLIHLPPFAPCLLPSLLLSKHAGPPAAWSLRRTPPGRQTVLHKAALGQDRKWAVLH